jgi:hypothetical protein
MNALRRWPAGSSAWPCWRWPHTHCYAAAFLRFAEHQFRPRIALNGPREQDQGTLSCFMHPIAAHGPTGSGRSPPNTKACPKPPLTNFFDPITSASPTTTRPGSIAKCRPGARVQARCPAPQTSRDSLERVATAAVAGALCSPRPRISRRKHCQKKCPSEVRN